MSIRNILVAFNGTAPSERAVHLAIRVAQANDAHLTGLYAHTMPYYYAQLDAYLPADAMAAVQETEREHEKEVEAKFKALTDADGMSDRISFFSTQGYPNDVISEFARTYDLVVVGQPGGKAEDYHHEPHPDTIALQAGRPVLVAPRGYDGHDFTGGALVAWDGKRAASRALSDAMDLLEVETAITVLYVGDEEDVRQPGRDVLEHLSRHGLKPKLTVQQAAGISIADIVLNTCAETDAAILVMGAYEHSRFSEIILGGVTKDVLSQSHIPILISH